MLYRFIRDSFWGRTLYHISGHRLFSYEEESPNYITPKKYLVAADDLAASGGAMSAADTLQESVGASNPADFIIVDWNGDDDPENPQNWPLYQKVLFISEICLLTCSVYMGSAMYTPGIEQIMKEWEVNQVLATLPLTLFVVGYGIGPMVLSPMSENPIFGRTSIYITTLFVFFILQVPTALAKDLASLCVLRFISGFFASPALATGGASACDVVKLPYMPLGLAMWGLSAVCGPSFGPFFGSIFSQLIGWRWSFWFLLIVSGASFVVLGCFLPETYGPTILRRRAKRLRAKTGNPNIVSQGEIDNMSLTANEVMVETLWRPIEISTIEPIVLLINLYIALVYSVMYIWFEAFPIVFLEVYHFNLIQMGVCYLGIIVGAVIGASIYISLIYQSYTKVLLANGKVQPEVFLPITIFGGACMPVGIFIFGWSATESAHWLGPVIGVVIFAVGCLIIFQTLLNYLGMSFPKYIASAFAGNDLFRSVIAGCFPLFGKPLFVNLSTNRFPVGWGSSVLGFISVAMIAIPVLFYCNGPKLRAKSKYSGL